MIGKDSVPNSFSILELSSGNRAGGLRLPHLDDDQREGITAEAGFTAGEASRGLVIYNKTSRCIEYWNGKQWVSLCEGSGKMTVWPEPFNTKIDENGTMLYIPSINNAVKDTIDNFLAQDPDAPKGPFSFVMMVGSEYATVADEYFGEGMFSVKFQPNNSIHPRSAIVRVTNGVNGTYKDFLYTQEGYLCSGTPAPTIQSIQSIPADRKIALCKEGAVYLWIDASSSGYDNSKLDSLIWTRNGAEIARGVNQITVTQPGDYDVNMGFVGCNKVNNAVTVVQCSGLAPQSAAIVVAGNNGEACGGGQVKLWARKMGTGNADKVLWFKDGEKTPFEGESIPNAGAGTWFAVVESSSDVNCVDKNGNYTATGYSVPSQTVTVLATSATGSTPLTTPLTVDLGGGFCEGSTKMMKVTSHIDDGATYTWYADNTEIGTGAEIIYSVPNGIQKVIIRCRATKQGECAVESAWNEYTVGAGDSTPTVPYISGDKALCNGRATLNIVPMDNVSSATAYAWYKDGKKIGYKQQITVTSGGDYYASYIIDSLLTGSCASPMAHINIPNTNSTQPIVSFTYTSSTVNAGGTVIYTALPFSGTKKNYSWNVEPGTTGATVVSGGGYDDDFVAVKYATAGTATVTLEAFNECGSARTAPMSVTVGNTCASVSSVTSRGSKTLNVFVNKSVTLGPISATLSQTSAECTYQWYSGDPNGSRAVISGATNNSYMVTSATEGTFNYYCEVKSTCPGSMPSEVYTVNVGGSLPATMGASKFTGRTSFDINSTDYTNGSANACGATTSAWRKDQRADFSIRTEQDPQLSGDINLKAPYTGKQVYTLTPASTETVSNVRFYYDDPTGEAIESIVPNGYKVTVTYKESLQTSLRSKTRAQALEPILYAVYNNGSADVMLRLTIHLQDCGYCGAKTDQGGWLTFMCHNLGADENLNPFTDIAVLETVTTKQSEANAPDGNLLKLDIMGMNILDVSQHLERFNLLNILGWNLFSFFAPKPTTYVINRTGSIMGDLYQWGRNTDGHQVVYSKLTEDRSSSINPKHDKFISVRNKDWYKGTSGIATRWGNGTYNINVPKGVNDPCPKGWKVPSLAQWQSIVGSTSEIAPNEAGGVNKWMWRKTGYLVGNALFLPAANSREGDNGFFGNGYNGESGNYWSSTFNGDDDQATAITFQEKEIRPDIQRYTVDAMSIRCVSE